MKKILLVSNTLKNLTNFRRELIEKLIEDSYEVILAAPFLTGDQVERKELEKKGCILIHTPIDSLGTNFCKDVKLTVCYRNIIKVYKPSIVITYTIKPNIYGGIACRLQRIPYMSNVTGLGRSIENRGILQWIVTKMYRSGLRKSSCVFFQNTISSDYMKTNQVVGDNSKIVAGSGVNLARFTYLPYPVKETVDFLLIARIMKEKGIEEYLVAAKTIKDNYPNANFHICGSCEVEYTSLLAQCHEEGFIQYHGEVKDMKPFYEMADCIVLPSYAEGMSNALLEAAASGRAVIASAIEGCKETFEEGASGFGVKVQDSKDLTDKIETFLLLTLEEKIKFGKVGRKKMETEFDRKVVTDSYMKEIEKLLRSVPNESF